MNSLQVDKEGQKLEPPSRRDVVYDSEQEYL